MRDKPEHHIDSIDCTVKGIRSKTYKCYSYEDKIRIVFAGFRGVDTISELCRQEGIPSEGKIVSDEGVFVAGGHSRYGGNRNIALKEELRWHFWMRNLLNTG